MFNVDPNRRLCRKCGKRIPYKAKVCGKKVNLKNRVFCLTCSPYGSRNTKKDDPARKSLRPRKFPYPQWSIEEKKAFCEYQRIRGYDRKREIISILGGKCIKCGYDKCIAALEFHHGNPKEKAFDLSTRTISKYSLKRILDEVKKCDLLCSNCHREQTDIDNQKLRGRQVVKPSGS